MSPDVFSPNSKPKKKKGFELSNKSLTNLVLASFCMMAITMGTVLYDQFFRPDIIVPVSQTDIALVEALTETNNALSSLRLKVEESLNAGTNVRRTENPINQSSQRTD